MVGVRLDAEKRAFVVEHYFRTCSYTVVRERFCNKFVGDPVPNKSTIKRLIDNFQTNYTLDPKKKTRRPSVVTPEKLEEIRSKVEARPDTSVRKLALQTSIHRSSAHRALKRLKLRAYRAMLVQELLPLDAQKRLEFCSWFQKFLNRHSRTVSAFDYVFFSDEAWFHKTGYINANNYRFWCSENPHIYRETSLHPEKIGVWCALSRKRIIGPIFFTSTVNTEVYKDIITQFISQLEVEERRCWFQQDGAPAHTASETLEFLGEFFDERLISKGIWPPRSPDLSPPDFFLWGHLKNRVFRAPVHNLEDLKSRITEEINAISPSQLNNVFKSLMKRVALCKGQLGSHFQQFL